MRPVSRSVGTFLVILIPKKTCIDRPITPLTTLHEQIPASLKLAATFQPNQSYHRRRVGRTSEMILV